MSEETSNNNGGISPTDNCLASGLGCLVILLVLFIGYKVIMHFINGGKFNFWPIVVGLVALEGVGLVAGYISNKSKGE